MKSIPTETKTCKKDNISPRGQARISCPPQVVTGIDKLEVSVWLISEEREIFTTLSEKKKMCQDLDLPKIPISLGLKNNFTWNLNRTGTKQYSFILKSGDITLQLSPRSHESNFPNCLIEIGSVSSQKYGFRIYDRLIQWLKLYGLIKEKDKISRVDLASDLIGVNIQEIGLALRDKWICRARKFAVYYEGIALTGIMLGKDKICLRVYDKKKELVRNKTKKEFFLGIWKCDEHTEVTRIEFQFRREFLNEIKLKIITVSDLEKNVDSLWQYACNDWARLARRSIDQKNKNQSRAELSEIWTRTQGAIFNFPSMANIREKKTLTKNLIALRDQARGCILNLAAACGHDEDDYFGIIKTCSEAISNDLAAFMSDKYNDYVRLFNIRRNECYVGF